MESTRRQFISTGARAAAGAGILCDWPALAFSDEKANPTSPVEDLMREHGALNRILLIYEEALRRLRVKESLDESLDPAWIARSAGIIRDFIESYHEKLEEEFVFPRLKTAGRLVELVDTLLTQHRAGRKLTEAILALSTPAHLKNAADTSKLEDALAGFVRMYRPHEAREDTVLFPEFKKIVPPKEYDRLGERFEDREHELFGKEGFDGIVGRIAEIEKALGIYDLSRFTPAQSPK